MQSSKPSFGDFVVKHEMVFVFLVGVIFLMLAALWWVGSSHMEARTYNKFTTGPRATVIDAMFADLRIEANRAGNRDPD